MKINSRILGSAAASCVLGLAFTPHSSAVVSDEDFNALKSMVQQMNQQMEDLKKTHAQDQQQIQQFKQQLGDTQTQVTNAVEKADAVAQVQATPARSPLHNFTMVGDAEIQYAKTYGNGSTFGPTGNGGNGNGGSHGGFLLADFAPIFLYQANQRILFEAGFDVMLNNSTTGTHDSGTATSVSMSFGQLDYIVNDYVTFVGGYMLLPLGTYSERGAGWLNKMPDTPLGRDLLANQGAGVQLRGAIPVGESGQSFTYAVYCANGPSSTDGTGNVLDANGNPNLDLGGNVGLQSDGSTGNLHSSPAGGGRLGWFVPLGGEHRDFEIGLSGQAGAWDDRSSYNWSAGVLDYALHWGSNIEIKGEFINTWYGTADAGNIHTWATWTQAGYKLAGLNLDLPVISDIELVGRFDKESNGLTGAPNVNFRRYTVGGIYYLTNTLLFEGDYEFIHNDGVTAQPSNFLVFQVSYGF